MYKVLALTFALVVLFVAQAFAQGAPELPTEAEQAQCYMMCVNACLEHGKKNGPSAASIEIKCGMNDRIIATCSCYPPEEKKASNGIKKI